MRRPVWVASRAWFASGAGIDAPPGRTNPRASAIEVMVLAVPMVMQCPKERAIPSSTSVQSACVILPSRRSSQYFQESDPLPSGLPFQLPRSIGPAGKNIVGSAMEIAPISRPGVVLSQPPISTQASTGCERSSSSVSMARKLRYIMVDGLTMGSDREIAGSSIGNPPACNTPRFTYSTRSLKCTWHWLMSDQVLTIPMTGLPVQSAAS